MKDFNGIDSNNNGLIERDEILQLSLETLENIFDGEEPGAVSETLCVIHVYVNDSEYRNSLVYSQKPSKRGGPYKQGSEKIPTFNNRGVKINGGWELE